MEQLECSETSIYKIQTQVGAEIYTYMPIKMEQSVPKRRHINFRRREITQKRTYNKDDVNYIQTKILEKVKQTERGRERGGVVYLTTLLTDKLT
jgi:hypothetical protein